MPPTKNATRPCLQALTPEAKAALGGAEIELASLPYRIGRESRKMTWTEAGMRTEQRDPDSVPNNDLYLVEAGEPMNVSREHCQIEADGAGWALVDRKSTCGTIVEGEVVGGRHEGGRISLRDGDVILIGTAFSPYVFRFRVR